MSLLRVLNNIADGSVKHLQSKGYKFDQSWSISGVVALTKRDRLKRKKGWVCGMTVLKVGCEFHVRVPAKTWWDLPWKSQLCHSFGGLLNMRLAISYWGVFVTSIYKLYIKYLIRRNNIFSFPILKKQARHNLIKV